jgi:DnaJ family protein B protein 4
MTNHYETLGVSNDATDDQIKRAYRKLSLQYHPDRNPSPEAQAKFQAINEANEILCDPGRRQQYDNELNGGGARMDMMGQEFRDINNIFSAFFGGGGPGPGIHMFHGGGPGFPNMFFENMNKPPPIIKNMILTLDQSYSGGSFPIELERWSLINNVKTTERQTIYINVPPGIDDNELIVLRDLGNSINQTIKGDVKITISVTNNTTFTRHGLDLLYKKRITLKEALCGFEFEIPHINKKTLNFKNKLNHAIVHPGFRKIIPEYGMKRENHVGNLILEFEVIFPEQLPIETVNAISELL